MLAALIVISIILSAAVIALLVLLLRPKKENNEGLVFIQNQLNEVVKTLDSKLGESSKVIDAKLSESSRILQNQFGESAKIIRDVTERLTKLDETNRQVVNFADQLKKLQDVLQNPKQRGILGEYYLETVLKNVLPPDSYKMQYQFKDGVIVDAAILIEKRVIPIDSKFSLENYNRILETQGEEKKRFEQAFLNDLKERINETAKYVKPEQGTMDFAFMFIPSEAIYYDLLINKIGAITEDTKSLVQYAYQKKVMIVSPTSFLAYLQTVLQGLKNQKISQQAQEIIKYVENLTKHLLSYEDSFRKIGTNLGTTVNMYNIAYKEFKKIDKDIVKISGKTMDVEPKLIDKPHQSEDLE